MITDEELEMLGEYFTLTNWHEKGWRVHEFVDAYLAGYIGCYIHVPKCKRVNEFTSKRVNMIKRIQKWL